MSLGGLGNSPIPKGVKFGGRSSAPTYKSGGGAERTINVGGNGRVYHDVKRSALARALNNRNVNITNINNDRGGVSSGSGLNTTATIFGALTAAAGLGLGITQMARGFGGGNPVTGAQGFSGVTDGAGVTSSNSYISDMENSQTAAELYENIQHAKTRHTDLGKVVNSESQKTAYKNNQSALTDVRGQIKDQQAAVKDLSGELKITQNELSSKKAKLQSDKSQLGLLDANYKTACEATVNAKASYESAVSAKVAAEQTVTSLEAQLKNTNLTPEQKSDLETKLATAKTKLQEAEGNVSTKKGEWEKAQQNEEAALKAVDVSKADIKALKESIEATTGQVKTLEEKQEKQQETLEAANKKLEALQAQEDELKTKIEDFEAKQKEYTELDAAIKAQEKRLAKLEKQGEKDAEKAGKKAKDSNYWANQHKEYADAAHGRGDKITENMETGLQGKAEANRTAAQQSINTAFESMGYGNRRVGDTFKIDGKTYTVVMVTENGEQVKKYQTGGGTPIGLDDLKLEFAKERSWHSGTKLSSAMSAGATN